MCAACVAQGVGYVGGALVALQVMAGRARAKRDRVERAETDQDPVIGANAEPSESRQTGQASAPIDSLRS